MLRGPVSELSQTTATWGSLHKSDIIVRFARTLQEHLPADLVGFPVSESFVEAGFANFKARYDLSYGQPIADMGSGLLHLWP